MPHLHQVAAPGGEVYGLPAPPVASPVRLYHARRVPGLEHRARGVGCDFDARRSAPRRRRARRVHLGHPHVMVVVGLPPERVVAGGARSKKRGEPRRVRARDVDVVRVKALDPRRGGSVVACDGTVEVAVRVTIVPGLEAHAAAASVQRQGRGGRRRRRGRRGRGRSGGVGVEWRRRRLRRRRGWRQGGGWERPGLAYDGGRSEGAHDARHTRGGLNGSRARHEPAPGHCQQQPPGCGGARGGRQRGHGGHVLEHVRLTRRRVRGVARALVALPRALPPLAHGRVHEPVRHEALAVPLVRGHRDVVVPWVHATTHHAVHSVLRVGLRVVQFVVYAHGQAPRGTDVDAAEFGGRLAPAQDADEG
mmetsp:Transcript_37964/g.94096  ORF Transcript_37964/g.94096 Transcript_37964/m.94096 type:complete len:363 (+) Transcript_37964:8383-9471(+)